MTLLNQTQKNVAAPVIVQMQLLLILLHDEVEKQLEHQENKECVFNHELQA